MFWGCSIVTLEFKIIERWLFTIRYHTSSLHNIFPQTVKKFLNTLTWRFNNLAKKIIA